MKNLIIGLFATGIVASAQAQDFSNRNNPYQQRPVVEHVLTGPEFDRIYQTIKRTPFNDDKKPAFRSLMRGNFMTVNQVQLLLKQFAFNDDKLDWAIMAYPYTIDQKQFYRLRGEFSFISTQEAFDQFVQNAATYNRGKRSYRLMGRDEFADMQTMMKKEAFTDGKKNIFKLAIQNKLITVAQVNELLRQLTFDDDKLTWAIMAYDYTADINHYYQLRDVFTFSSNKEKLDKFLLNAAE